MMGGKNVFKNMNTEFLHKLDTLREMSGIPIKLTSSYRSPSYNKMIGGAKRSYHMRGRAVDIECHTSKDRAIYIKNALALGLTVGVMRTALHIDDRENQILFHYYPRYSSTRVEQETNG
jgi:hypothetical protein